MAKRVHKVDKISCATLRKQKKTQVDSEQKISGRINKTDQRVDCAWKEAFLQNTRLWKLGEQQQHLKNIPCCDENPQTTKKSPRCSHN